MAGEWEAVVGLEVHAHLKTRTKMFCRCELEYGAPENTRTCPVCLAHPGSLPVPNGRAIEMTILLGLALDCEIAERAIFARKNYFYPDLPKGYQISQYEAPLCGPGRFAMPGGREIGIVRAHLEEDAAKTVHAGGATGRSVGADYSLVDFNRGGTPLLEIVTEPDLRSADEAMEFLRLLRQTIRELGISDADMEKGTLRADVNVSVRRRGEEGFRPRWEIKNMNSFRFVGRAIDAAFRQQVAAHEAGEEVVQSTYDYDPDTDRLTVHRSKEEADDYRYFPEPDLVPVEPPAELVERLRGELPERPGERIARLAGQLGFEAAAELVTTGNERKAEALAAEGLDWRTAAAIAMNRGDFLRENAAALARIVEANVTREALDEAFAAAAEGAIDADDYLARTAVSDESELEPVIDAVVSANPQQVETYLGGKEGVLGFLVGQVMRETQGKADPKVVNRLLRERLRRE
ncbi:MAG TPA: Asp-tRNA(Asn)/Glu-tRNA(Gln) amidotransferase subunit GatB [Gaiellaceae bacterium]|jgi:aspartyl-tRNA(Asn)/glutamyl-tRNA(Gln) amidotransferase subunit B|nr:Asp-tRNA(Asn)/Glu-tRNA(Gln) amidotransferase subunit GatB [Gaiellaceae bacterium]